MNTVSKKLGSTSTIRRARRAAKHSKKSQRRAKTTAKSVRVSRRPNATEATPGPWRIRLVLGVFTLAAIVLVGRAVDLQILRGEELALVAERQATTSSRIHAKRGVIADRHGSRLAITVDVDSVFAEPRRVEEPKKAARQLAPILKTNRRRLEKKLSSRRAFAYLRRRVDASLADRVEALKIRGIGTHTEPKRFYANVGLAAHVLGFVNLEGKGKAGVERHLDDELRGRSHVMPAMRDALGNLVFSEGFTPPGELEGKDIVLTIDRQIQHAAETALARMAEKFDPKGASAIVMHPASGEILAMASWPSFNPNNLSGSTSKHHINRAISAVYEPGSTLKLVTISAALEDGVVRPDSIIDCEDGRWKVGGRTIRDDVHRYGELTVTEVLKVSSNICSAKIGFALGRERLEDWLYTFGMGKKTGVELPGELRGLIRPSKTWRDIALANISFGQGIAVTPLQIVQAASTIANDGVLVAPRIVRSVGDKKKASPEARRVLSAKTAQTVRRMMVEVTKDGGTAKKARVPGFEVAGKTGTAQKIDPVTKGYSHELFIASFVGLVPAEDPEVAILVLVDEPKGSIYGGVVAAPAFSEIASAALAAREVFPEAAADAAELQKALVAPPRAEVAAATGSDEKWFESEGIDEVPTDESALEGALSARAQALLGDLSAKKSRPKDAAKPASPKSGPRVPNFGGLGLSEVLNRSADAGCDPLVHGTGRVYRQKPARGRPLEPGSVCEVWLGAD